MSEPDKAVIFGNGPSLDHMPQAFWSACKSENLLLAGSNRALVLRSCQDLDWDVLFLRDPYRRLWLDQRLGEAYHETLWKPCPVWKVAPASNRSTWCDEYMQPGPAWADDDAGRRTPASVVLLAAQWLWQRGIRHLFLVGVDYRGGHAQMREPFNAPTRGKAGCRDEMFDRVFEQFRRATAYIQSEGGSLRNLSPHSALPYVPALAIESFLEECSE